MDRYDIREGAYEWMKRFLHGRSQQVFAQNTLSSKGLVTIGVPQGSILGPYSPYSYVSDLPNSFDINTYADDTELHCCHSQLQRVEQVVQNEVE